MYRHIRPTRQMGSWNAPVGGEPRPLLLGDREKGKPYYGFVLTTLCICVLLLNLYIIERKPYICLEQ